MPRQNFQLEYGHRAALWKRRWVRYCVLGLALGTGTLAIGYRWGPPIYERGRLLYWQRQCLRYAAPADRIVYDDNPTEAPKLLKNGYKQLSAAVDGYPVAVDERSLKCWNEYSGWNTASPLLFLHERRRKGARRLVAVHLRRAQGITEFEGFCEETLPLRPNSNESSAFWSHLVDCGRIAWLYVRDEPKGPHLRFYAGQPDPADESHFTIGYELGGQRGTIDGWLRDDPDCIELKVRDGPAKPDASAPSPNLR